MQRGFFRLVASLAFCLALLLPPNMAVGTPPMPPGHRSGLLMAGGARGLGLREANVQFAVGTQAGGARVEADYIVENLTGSEIAADLVWAFADLYNEDPQPPVITLDGAPLTGQVVTDADLYRPKLADWLAERPALVEEFKRVSDPASEDDLKRLMSLLSSEGTGYASRGETQAMIRFTRDEATRQDVRTLTYLLLRNEWNRLREGWRPWVTEYAQNFYWVNIPVTLPPGAVRTIHLSYSQMTWSGFWYHFLPEPPAAGWERTGPIHISAQIPKQYGLRTSAAVRKQDGVYTFDVAGRPEELSFQVVLPPPAPRWLEVARARPWLLVPVALAAAALVFWLLRRRSRTF